MIYKVRITYIAQVEADNETDAINSALTDVPTDANRVMMQVIGTIFPRPDLKPPVSAPTEGGTT